MRLTKKIIVALVLLPLSVNAKESDSINKAEARKSPPIERIDENNYKIGKILINKIAREFTIPAVFLRNSPPLEFLAVAKGGGRGYESLLEVDASVYEFNLACILIGLDKHKGAAPEYHFDPAPIKGDAVEIIVSWQDKGKTVHYDASELFSFNNKKLSNDNWVYTGSSFLPNGGGYRAELDGGTLVGFIHDPASIIEHKTGFSGESYSLLTINESLIPELNTAVTVKFKYTGFSE